MRAHPETADWARGIPEPLRAPILRCARGELPANVALMQVFAAAHDEKSAAAALNALPVAVDELQAANNSAASARVGEMLSLHRARPQAWRLTRSILASVDAHSGAAQGSDTVDCWAQTFDRAAAVSADAGVALYALGSPELLRAATDEVVAWMVARDLLGPRRDVLELGCGAGRILQALGPLVRSATGTDISRAMLAHARERCARLRNVRLLQASGRDLAAFAGGSFDLVCAIDVFPYIVEAGERLTAAHIQEAARVLRPAGSLVIFNFSYRGNLEADQADLRRLARAFGFDVVTAGERPFRHWDGAAFHLHRANG